MEKIRQQKTAREKTDTFSKFIEALASLQDKLKAEKGDDAVINKLSTTYSGMTHRSPAFHSQNASLYPILRLFLPKWDTERDSYGIRTTTLGKLFVKALAINPKSDAGQKLLAQQGMTGKCSDFGDIVFEVMSTRSPPEGSLTVFEVNGYLDLISDHFKQNERRSARTLFK